MRNIKLNVAFALMLCVAMIFSGCKSENINANKHTFSKPKEYQIYSQQFVASNDKYSLYWDSDTDCILLMDNNSKYVWSTIPYDFYSSDVSDGLAHVRMTSPINIEYYDSKTRSISTSYGSLDVIEEGHTASKKVKNGVKVTYYFDKLNISVPVVYSLGEDFLKVTLLINEIGEKDKKVYSVTVSPYLCSTKAKDDSWLFLPSGSGTIMYADEGKRQERNASVKIFGEELSETISQSLSDKGHSYLPVYGAGNNENAIMGVISSGSEFVRLDAQAGNSEIGYSTISPTFLVRNVDILKVSQMYSGYKALVRKSTDMMVDAQSASISFYPLANGKANYSGMAEKYRNILFGDKQPDANYDQLYIDFLGGANVNKNFLGVNYKVLKAATTYSEAKKILSELYNETKTPQIVTLTGYGKSGLDIEKIAGGFKLASTFGSKKELNELIDYCKSNNGQLAIDYDILRFRNSGNGVSSFTDATLTANGTKAKQYYFSKTNYLPKDIKEYYYLLARDKIESIEFKLANTLDKKGISAVSLSDLGNITYSDSSDAKYISKNGFAQNVSAFLKYLKKNGKEIILSSPNSYAAVYADFITASPTQSSLDDAFDLDVPFYQMVMHGYVPMAVEPINLSEDIKEGFLYAIETGSSLSYTLTSTWQNGFEDTEHPELKYSSYDLWKGTIVEDFNSSKEYLKKISSATIEEHTTIAEGVTKTVFSNGIVSYVNHTEKPVNTPIGEIDANSFHYIKE